MLIIRSPAVWAGLSDGIAQVPLLGELGVPAPTGKIKGAAWRGTSVISGKVTGPIAVGTRGMVAVTGRE